LGVQRKWTKASLVPKIRSGFGGAWLTATTVGSGHERG
jgi:hypothetical protein